MLQSRALTAAAVAITMTAAIAGPASAACTRLAFSVNDYGKDGPTKDAKGLLDKYIAKWAADRKITGYTTGTKAVSCELFLDVILFDEYTCKAEATVCWNGPLPPGHVAEPAPGAAPSVEAKPAPSRAKAATKAAADGSAAPAAAPIATGSVTPAPAAAPATPKAPPAAAPARAPAAPAAAPAPAPN